MNGNVIRLHPKDHEALVKAIESPPEPNEALRRLMHNETILERLRGIPANVPGKDTQVGDPVNRDPNVR